MEATQVQQLKLNVTNINSFLKKSNKTYIGLKKQNSTLLSNQIQRRKQESKEKKIETRRATGFGLGKVGDKIASVGGSIFDKILGFGSFILAGVLVNSLPAIAKKVMEFVDNMVNFVTPIYSSFRVLQAIINKEPLDDPALSPEKKRFTDELKKAKIEVDKLKKDLGIAGPIISPLQNFIGDLIKEYGGDDIVLATKKGEDGKDIEGFLNLKTDEFFQKQFTTSERERYEQQRRGAGGAPSSGVGESSGSSGKYGSLLDFIGSGEGGYNSMNQGTQGNSIVGSTNNASSKLGKNLTDMTIGEIMDRQAYLMNRSNPQISDYGIFAAGKYQIIPGTMPGAVAGAGLSRSDKFTPQNQDKLGMALIMNKRPYVGKYLRGEHNDVQGAMLELAREFASMPDPNTGRSLYGSGNRAFHSVDEVREALIKARNKPQPKITPKTRDKNNQASVLNTTIGEEGTTTFVLMKQQVIT